MTFPNELIFPNGSTPIVFRPGLSTIVVGANGSGKTRLAMNCEEQLGAAAHRVSAQRMLSIDPSIEKITEKSARDQLRYGAAVPSQYGGWAPARENARWGGRNPRFILDDAGSLIQVLFGEQANTAVTAYNAAADGVPVASGETLMRRLRAIFQRVLPNRDLVITADNISVVPLADDGATGAPYSATELSDGEKAVMYMIGQVLVADPASVLIMDEPEIHIHRSILGRLWDELESARPDCAFLLITHDLEFAASRAGKKYVVRSYSPSGGWVIDDVPEADGFSEDLVTLILGSRKPILFVEGEHGSLDVAFYRACYPGWTVVPRGSCEAVIHSVVTMRRNAELTRVQCSGLVDADSHNEQDREGLASNGIRTLPVSEIENLLLLPTISRAILKMDHLDDQETAITLAALQAAILADASNPSHVEEVVLRHCRRRIDRMLKQVDLSADKTVAGLAANYATRTSRIDVSALASEIESKISASVDAADLPALLAVWDRKKSLLALAASHLRHTKVDVFSAWTTRAIQSKEDTRLRDAVHAVLPVIVAV
ncbi:AAA family ATPase [Cryobacterium sp. M15]|uniref:AAA family ATPase n=1 Tax=Cryobacterium sp. M15 TaxID=2048291 RepID=UPI0018EAA416|nr:AAA family ATPase [Cryobacterium sp. M15]